jgi:hypothetical protein
VELAAAIVGWSWLRTWISYRARLAWSWPAGLPGREGSLHQVLFEFATVVDVWPSQALPNAGAKG